MPKKTLSRDEQIELRSALQLAVADALMAARRWEPSEIAFQGGTGLHLAYGSPRFSEDLDFLVREDIRLTGCRLAVASRIGRAGWIPRGLEVAVSDEKADERNPHAFVISLGGANVIGSVKVKVEMWKTAATVMDQMQVETATLRSAGEVAGGLQAFVPTLTLAEIFADKVYALAARDYLKPRDVYDLHWLAGKLPGASVSPAQLRVRYATYPGTSLAAWRERAVARVEQLGQSAPSVAQDLARWLPAYAAPSVAQVEPMIRTACAALEQAMTHVDHEASEEGEGGHAVPSPA